MAKEERFSIEQVKIIARKRTASKVFKSFYIIPAIIAGAVGTTALLGSSVVSGIGLFEQKKIISNLENASETNFETLFTKFTTNLKVNLEKTLKGVTTISDKNIDSIMYCVSNQYFSAFKIPMPHDTEVAILGQIKTSASSVDNITTFVTELIKFISDNKNNVQTSAKTSVQSIIFNLYGIVDTKTNEYSKTYIWKIVFGVTTAVAGIMVLSIIGYWIARINERRKAKRNVEALRKVAEAADDKNVEYIITKINNRYSLD